MGTQKKQAKDEKSPKTIEIKIALSPLPKPPASVHKAYKKSRAVLARVPRKILLTGGALGAVVIVGFISYQLLSTYAPRVADKITINGGRPQLQRGRPDYHTVLPAGKNIDDLGGWTRISPPDRNPVFAYVDKIGNTQINVSQQPLPNDLKAASAGGLNLLAEDYNANEKITVGNSTVYIGTASSGPQSVIFIKSDVLILIKSSAKIDSNHWAEYVSSLR